MRHISFFTVEDHLTDMLFPMSFLFATKPADEASAMFCKNCGRHRSIETFCTKLLLHLSVLNTRFAQTANSTAAFANINYPA